jgi:hypothetical protein
MSSLSPNKYVNNYVYGPTQKLQEDLIIEAIKFHGVWTKYLPKTAVNIDDLFGESTVNEFNDAVEVEMYIHNTEGFDGQRLMSKLGVTIQDEMKLTVARKRFEEVRLEYVVNENGDNIEAEYVYQFWPDQSGGILLEDGNNEGYSIEYSRPREGDLLWIPIMQRMFEIKFVQNDAIFYQGGHLPTFDLFVELFEYSHEKLDTGSPVIDSIEDLFSGDIMRDSVTMEDDKNIGLEDSTGQIVSEDINPEDSDKQADNSLFDKENDGVIDFSELNPWVKRNEAFKW